ncbi:MAG: hypothetical protein N3G20_00680 [Verrucomicrobiae bacterium]|nr:hypothetical protein [Verrucomicrobiae bacterium]
MVGLIVVGCSFFQAQLIVSCGDMWSGGGSTELRYQYELLKPTQSPLVITNFSIGTDDLIPLNYTARTVPGSVGYNWVPLLKPGGVREDGAKTLHATPAPQPTKVTSGVIQFIKTGGLGTTLLPGTAALFRFNTPNSSIDEERKRSTSMSVCAADVPGPGRVYPVNLVHGPVPKPSSYALVLGLGTLGFVGLRRLILVS